MIDFHSSRAIKATRKAHACEECGQQITAGSQAHYHSGKYDGYIYANYTHVECHEAALQYAEQNDMWGEDWPWFQHMENSEHEHHAWLLEKHPVVAARLNIKQTEAA